MAVAVFALDGVVQNAADSATGWSAGGVDTDSKIEGSGCIGAKTGAGVTRYNHLGTARDFSGGGAEEGDHVIAWFNFLTFANLETLANGGVRLFVGNDQTPTDFEEFTITGLGAGYFGGWVAAIADPTAAGDFSGGTLVLTAVDAFGITYNATAGIMGNFNNGLVDQITIGKGILLTAGDGASDPGDFQGFLDADEGSAIWGWVARLNNIVFAQCKFFIGNGTTTTEFVDINETVVFLDRPVATDFYEFFVQTDATCTLGAIASGVTSGGCTFDSAGASKYTLTVTVGGTVEAIFNAYATLFRNFRQADLNPSSTLQDCTFDLGGTVTQNGADLLDCNVSNSTATAALAVDTPTAVEGGLLVGNNVAYDYTGSATSFTIDGTKFSGNTTDVRVNNASDVEVFLTNGANAATCTNTGAGGCTLTQSVTVAVTIVDGNQVPISGARVEITANETVGTITIGDVILTGTTNGSGLLETTAFNYEGAFDPSGLEIAIKVRSASSSPFYKPRDLVGIIFDTGFSQTIGMALDES